MRRWREFLLPEASPGCGWSETQGSAVTSCLNLGVWGRNSQLREFWIIFCPFWPILGHKCPCLHVRERQPPRRLWSQPSCPRENKVLGGRRHPTRCVDSLVIFDQLLGHFRLFWPILGHRCRYFHARERQPLRRSCNQPFGPGKTKCSVDGGTQRVCWFFWYFLTNFWAIFALDGVPRPPSWIHPRVAVLLREDAGFKPWGRRPRVHSGGGEAPPGVRLTPISAIISAICGPGEVLGPYAGPCSGNGDLGAQVEGVEHEKRGIGFAKPQSASPSLSISIFGQCQTTFRLHAGPPGATGPRLGCDTGGGRSRSAPVRGVHKGTPPNRLHSRGVGGPLGFSRMWCWLGRRVALCQIGRSVVGGTLGR